MPAIIAAVKLAQIAVVVTGSVIALTQAPVILVNLAGFTAAGVKAGKVYVTWRRLLTDCPILGSIAAATQSAVYGGLTTGLFAGLQSFGATAAVSIPALAGGLASAAAGVAAMVAV